MTQPVETADPAQYFRLLLVRLLETQKCLSSKMNESSLAFAREQFLLNGYTLSEVKSWIEDQGTNALLGGLPVSAQDVVNCGGELPPLVGLPPRVSVGGFTNTSAKSVEPLKVPHGKRRAASSPRSESTLPDSATITNGSVTFQLESSDEKPDST